MLEKKLISRGIYLSYLHLLVGLLYSFLLIPIMLRYLGQSAYGLWAAFGSFVGYFAMLDFGMNLSAVKYTAEYHAKNEKQILSRVISSILVLLIFVALVIILVCAVLAPFVATRFHLPEDLVKVGQIAFVIMGVGIAARLVGSVFGNILYGYQRVDLFKACGIAQLVANAILVIVLLRSGYGLMGVVAASLLSVLFQIALYLLVLRRTDYRIDIRPGMVDLKTLKRIGPYSLRNFSLGLTSQVLYRTDNIVIGMLLGAAFVTPYAIAYQLCFIAASVCSKVSDTIFPKFTRLYTDNDMDGLRSLYLRTSKITMAISMPFVLFIAFFGPSFIEVWVGEGNFVGISVLLVLVAMIGVHSLVPSSQLLQAVGKNRVLMFSEWINAGLNLSLSIILVQKIGWLGVALGTLTAHLCTSTWIVPYRACKHAGLPVRTFLLSGILPPILAAVPVGLLTWSYIHTAFPNDGYGYLAVKGIMIAAAYAVVYLTAAVTKEERRSYLSFFPRIGRLQVRIQALLHEKRS